MMGFPISQLPKEVGQLGDGPTAQYPTRLDKVAMGLVAGPAIIAFGLYYFWAYGFADVGMLVLIGVGGLMGVNWMVKAIPNRDISVLLYPGGLVYRRRGRILVCRWDQI